MIARRVGQETRCADCRTMLPTGALVVEVHRRLLCRDCAIDAMQAPL